MMKQYGLFIDFNYCTGCRACELSCKNEKELPRGEWGIKVMELGPAKIAGKWLMDFVPIPSHVCDCCIDRIEKCMKPPCEIHCLGKCLEVLPLEELSRRLADNPSSKTTVFIP